MHNHAKSMTRRPAQQRGSALIISLLILVVLTLIGITAMGTSGMEEKMAGNDRDKQVAFQSAEVALRGAEAAIEDLASTAGFDGTNGQYPEGTRLDFSPDSAVWTGTASAVYAGAVVPEAKTAPRYVIQILATQGNQDVNIGGYGTNSGVGKVVQFRVTARGTGISDTSSVILQSYYGKLLN